MNSTLNSSIRSARESTLNKTHTSSQAAPASSSSSTSQFAQSWPSYQSHGGPRSGSAASSSQRKPPLAAVLTPIDQQRQPPSRATGPTSRSSRQQQLHQPDEPEEPASPEKLAAVQRKRVKQERTERRDVVSAVKQTKEERLQYEFQKEMELELRRLRVEQQQREIDHYKTKALKRQQDDEELRKLKEEVEIAAILHIKQQEEMKLIQQQADVMQLEMQERMTLSAAQYQSFTWILQVEELSNLETVRRWHAQSVEAHCYVQLCGWWEKLQSLQEWSVQSAATLSQQERTARLALETETDGAWLFLNRAHLLQCEENNMRQDIIGDQMEHWYKTIHMTVESVGYQHQTQMRMFQNFSDEMAKANVHMGSVQAMLEFTIQQQSIVIMEREDRQEIIEERVDSLMQVHAVFVKEGELIAQLEVHAQARDMAVAETAADVLQQKIFQLELREVERDETQVRTEIDGTYREEWWELFLEYKTSLQNQSSPRLTLSPALFPNSPSHTLSVSPAPTAGPSGSRPRSTSSQKQLYLHVSVKIRASQFFTLPKDDSLQIIVGVGERGSVHTMAVVSNEESATLPVQSQENDTVSIDVKDISRRRPISLGKAHLKLVSLTVGMEKTTQLALMERFENEWIECDTMEAHATLTLNETFE
eukprot:TRINITY_DN67450_c3_g1_i1.p1 TRINITY_DN67450_c3_g1~~TRINITY_DN67450_c3_g1_i1.p1  ORF type:complete len:649 (-),score=58.72 TRINITY_DN67450_c3_g1_i1:32-1978(-)